MLKKKPITEDDDELKSEQADDDSKTIEVIKINYNDYFKNGDVKNTEKESVNSDEDDEEESEGSEDEDYESSEVNSNSNSAEIVVEVKADVNKKTDDEYNIEFIEEAHRPLDIDRQPIDTIIDQQNQIDQPDEDNNNVDDSNNRPFFIITWNKQEEEEEKYPVNKPIDYVIDSADRDFEIRYMKRKLMRIENLAVSTLQLLIVLALFVLVCNFLILITGASRKVRLFYFSPKWNQSQTQKQKHCDYKEKPLLDI